MIRAEIDPTKSYGHTDLDSIINAMGVLTDWATLAILGPEPIKETMEMLYGFGPLYEMQGGTIDEEGVYHYPEDDPMPPLGKMENMDNSRKIIFYPHAIIAFYEEGKYFVTRMD